MHFHYCGNPFHDVVHNSLVLLIMAPDWLPGMLAARDTLKRKLLKTAHTEETCPRNAEGTTQTGRMCASHPNTSNPPRDEFGRADVSEG